MLKSTEFRIWNFNFLCVCACMHVPEHVSQNMCRSQTTFGGSVLLLPLDFLVWGLGYQAHCQAFSPTELPPWCWITLKVWSLEIGLLALTLRRPGATGKLSHLKPMSPPLVIKAQKLGIVSSRQQPSVPCAHTWSCGLVTRSGLHLCPSATIVTLVNRKGV